MSGRTFWRAAGCSRRRRRAGTRVVFASSSSIYGDAASYPTPEDTIPRPLSPYGITKLACEHLARAYGIEFGLDVVTVRYFTIYGPRQRPDMAFTRMVTHLAEGRPFDLYGDGSQSRSFTYVDDAVEATIAAMERAPGGATYNVGGGAEVSMLEAIEALGPGLGPPTRDRPPPAARGRRGAHGGRHDPDPRRSRLGARDLVRGRPRGSVALGRC